ncbi:MAG: hypothetical protein J6L24_06385 [Oscillospiraceae bacterium]|nr:hypothetical protein [Oscillospiraceae bacterium]
MAEPSSALILTTSYCTRFFPRCKYFFYDFSENLQNFLERQEKKPQQPFYPPPKGTEYRPKDSPGGIFPEKSPGKQSGVIAQTQIPLTDPEAEKDPPRRRGQQKKKIRQRGEPWPQGTQKAIRQSQHHPDQTGRGKPIRGQRRSGHPSRRRSQPPDGFGSS